MNEKSTIKTLTIMGMILLLLISSTTMLATTNVSLGLSVAGISWSASQADIVGVLLGMGSYYATIASLIVAGSLSIAGAIAVL